MAAKVKVIEYDSTNEGAIALLCTGGASGMHANGIAASDAYSATGILDNGGTRYGTGVFDGTWYGTGILAGATRYPNGVFDGTTRSTLASAIVSAGGTYVEPEQASVIRVADGGKAYGASSAIAGTATLPAAANVQSGAADYGVAGALRDPAYPTTAATLAAAIHANPYMLIP